MKSKKIMMTLLLTLVISSLTTGCTTRSWYEGGQIAAEHECHRHPPSEMDQCLENLNTKRYGDYEQDLNSQ